MVSKLKFLTGHVSTVVLLSIFDESGVLLRAAQALVWYPLAGATT
jgi:hypothetical protein